MKSVIAMMYAVLVCISAISCATGEINARLERQAMQIDELQRRNAELEAQLASSELMNRELIERLRRDEEPPCRVADIPRYVEDEEIARVRGEDGEVLRLPGAILFNPGQAELTKKGKEIVEKVASILKSEYPGRTIRIEGHTDNQPIRKAKRYKSNWELSVARALQVLHYLADKGKIPQERMYVAGFGEWRPIADNTTAEGRKKNRRVEIVIVD